MDWIESTALEIHWINSTGFELNWHCDDLVDSPNLRVKNGSGRTSLVVRLWPFRICGHGIVFWCLSFAFSRSIVFFRTARGPTALQMEAGWSEGREGRAGGGSRSHGATLWRRRLVVPVVYRGRGCCRTEGGGGCERQEFRSRRESLTLCPPETVLYCTAFPSHGLFFLMHDHH